MELARAALLAKLNFSYRDMQEAGYLFPVIELFVRYAQPLLLGQKVRVIARIVEWESRLKVVYEIRDAATNRRLISEPGAVSKNNSRASTRFRRASSTVSP